MLFPSIEFAIFLVLVLGLNWGLSRLGLEDLRKWLLLAASLLFYAFWNIGFAIMLVAAAAVSWIVALANERLDPDRRGRLALLLGIGGALVLLGYYKYYNFLLSLGLNAGLFELLGIEPVFSETEIPIAISFFTFHAISYMVDAYSGRLHPSRSIRDVVLYISFFPHLVAGPIVRAADFMPQLEGPPPRQTAMPYADALTMIVAGLFKKMVFANYLAVMIVDPVFIAPGQFGAGDIALAIVAYAFQIYFDFSAYTGIAIGVAALFGYRFPNNFDQPYRSLSPREFWTRWHISLSTFLRDYLYIPLGGNRGGMLLTLRNLMLTMLLGGLWHGANLTFLVWGGMHGMALVVNHLWRASGWHKLLVGNPAYLALCWVGTTLFILSTWVFFRSPDFETAAEMFAGLFTRPEAPQLWTGVTMALLLLGLIGQFLQRDWLQVAAETVARQPLLVQGAGYLAAMVVLLLFAPSAAAPFIYFQF